MLVMNATHLQTLQEVLAVLKSPASDFADTSAAIAKLERLERDLEDSLRQQNYLSSRPDAAQKIAQMEACLAESSPGNWVAPVRLFRELTGLGLRESRDAVMTGNWRRAFEA